MREDTLKTVDEDSMVGEKFFEYMMNFCAGYQQLKAERERLQQRVAELESEKVALEEQLEQLRGNDGWSSRVTYENVVEQIAACEDAKERDEARKLIEPLLKKSQVTLFRRDIKKRVKELNEDSGATFNNYGTYTEVHPGGININNKKDGGN